MTTAIAEPTTRRFTREEYYRMAEIGMFEGQRVELIQGEIVEMSPQNNPHALAVMIIDRWLQRNLGDDFSIRCQLPLVASDDTEPEPDFAILPGSPESHRDHPTTALLVIEISDTTLAHDRRKAHIYAARQVPEYWTLNLAARQLEVCRNPEPAAGEPFGFRYAARTILAADQIIQAGNLPLPSIQLSRLLPAAD